MIGNQVAEDLRRCCDALEADNKQLRVALTTIKEWPITSPLNMDAYNMQVVAHAALAQEQGGSDAID